MVWFLTGLSNNNLLIWHVKAGWNSVVNVFFFYILTCCPLCSLPLSLSYCYLLASFVPYSFPIPFICLYCHYFSSPFLYPCHMFILFPPFSQISFPSLSHFSPLSPSHPFLLPSPFFKSTHHIKLCRNSCLNIPHFFLKWLHKHTLNSIIPTVSNIIIIYNICHTE